MVDADSEKLYGKFAILQHCFVSIHLHFYLIEFLIEIILFRLFLEIMMNLFHM